MRKRVLDTNRLIEHWRRRRAETPAVQWASHLIRRAGTDAIVRPVYLEFICGARGGGELDVMRAYLRPFQIIDGGDVRREDWAEARRIAERIPPRGKPRHLGDCLIRAICNRLRCDVDTADLDFPAR